MHKFNTLYQKSQCCAKMYKNCTFLSTFTLPNMQFIPWKYFWQNNLHFFKLLYIERKFAKFYQKRLNNIEVVTIWNIKTSLISTKLFFTMAFELLQWSNLHSPQAITRIHLQLSFSIFQIWSKFFWFDLFSTCCVNRIPWNSPN